MSHRIALLLAAVALAAPSAALAGTGTHAPWSLTLGVWAGGSRYDVLGLEHGVENTGSADGRDLIDGGYDVIGGMALLRVGWLELGALYEGTLLDDEATSEVLTPVVGFKVDVSDRIRLDVLGEAGGHRLTRIGSGNALVSDTETVWLPYVGVRPGISYRMPISALRLVFSVRPFARWDLVKKQIAVQTPSGPAERTYYEAGGTTFGVVGGIGIEL
jgi:hypothetical protein